MIMVYKQGLRRFPVSILFFSLDFSSLTATQVRATPAGPEVEEVPDSNGPGVS